MCAFPGLVGSQLLARHRELRHPAEILRCQRSNSCQPDHKQASCFDVTTQLDRKPDVAARLLVLCTDAERRQVLHCRKATHAFPIANQDLILDFIIGEDRLSRQARSVKLHLNGSRCLLLYSVTDGDISDSCIKFNITIG